MAFFLFSPKQLLGFFFRWFALSVTAGAFAILSSGPVLANSARLVSDMVVDPLTGVALNGFDPVSYFTDEAPMRGSADFEMFWRGVPWYFANEANLEIFSKSPDVYAPLYGGHGAMSLARGFLSDGNPMIYKVLDKRLYLFYSFSNREAFEMGDKIARINGINNWQQLRDGQD
ncbi:MAG: hypothetical protein L3J21_03610 [Devosiaceae bacterium]|nr:hypothetical protein [Devosiaceae bacterium]